MYRSKISDTRFTRITFWTGSVSHQAPRTIFNVSRRAWQKYNRQPDFNFRAGVCQANNISSTRNAKESCFSSGGKEPGGGNGIEDGWQKMFYRKNLRLKISRQDDKQKHMKKRAAQASQATATQERTFKNGSKGKREAEKKQNEGRRATKEQLSEETKANRRESQATPKTRERIQKWQEKNANSFWRPSATPDSPPSP